MHSLGLHDYSVSVDDIFDFPILSNLSIITVNPNPFSSTASVVFQSPGLASVTLEVFDVSGRLVKNQEVGAFSEGQQMILWDGSSSNGEAMANGVYIIRLESGSENSTTDRVIILR